MKLARRHRIRQTPTIDEIRHARARCRRWCAWLLAPTLLLFAAVAFRLDPAFVAVGLLGLPVVVIRLVESYGDYQQLRQEPA